MVDGQLEYHGVLSVSIRFASNSGGGGYQQLSVDVVQIQQGDKPVAGTE